VLPGHAPAEFHFRADKVDRHLDVALVDGKLVERPAGESPAPGTARPVAT
jgi:hypothetical protein